MTAVGAIAGLGVAAALDRAVMGDRPAGEFVFEVVRVAAALDRAVMGGIVVQWPVAPTVGFWVSGVIGRYLYPTITRLIAVESSSGPLLEVDRSGVGPVPRRGPNTTARELAGAVFVVAIGCLMAFSSGPSNVASATHCWSAPASRWPPLLPLGCGGSPPAGSRSHGAPSTPSAATSRTSR